MEIIPGDCQEPMRNLKNWCFEIYRKKPAGTKQDAFIKK